MPHVHFGSKVLGTPGDLVPSSDRWPSWSVRSLSFQGTRSLLQPSSNLPTLRHLLCLPSVAPRLRRLLRSSLRVPWAT